MTKPAEMRKALVAGATFVTSLIAYGVLPESAVPYALAALAALGTFGVYAVTNEGAPKTGEGGAADVGLILLVATFVLVLLMFLGLRVR